MIHISGAQNPNLLSSQKKAKQMYEEIGNRKRDVINVSRHTGFSIEQCQIIKNYAFIDRHILSSGYKPFFPDFAMASSWYRLAERDGNNIKAHDVLMLYHELYEIQLLIGDPNMTQATAHKLAEAKYNYAAACDTYYEHSMK